MVMDCGEALVATTPPVTLAEYSGVPPDAVTVTDVLPPKHWIGRDVRAADPVMAVGSPTVTVTGVADAQLLASVAVTVYVEALRPVNTPAALAAVVPYA